MSTPWQRVEFPRLLRIRQEYDHPTVADPARETAAALAALDLGRSVRPGQTVAVGCGSRGVADYAVVVRSAVAALRDLGLRPFLVPAMGSHGSGTAAGQVRVLEQLGLSPATVGAPIHSSLEVERIGETEDGVPVSFDRHALGADHVVVVNRIQEHTEFVNDRFESGLQKMLAIGFGKQAGAADYHNAMFAHGYARVIAGVARVVLAKVPVLVAIGIVENGCGRTARIGAAQAGGLVDLEAELFALAKMWSAKLPFEEADVLVMDEIGKDVSGTGFDTKVVGRIGLPLLSPEPAAPRIKRLVACDLTAASEGNAVGVGAADFITQRLADKIDHEALAMNVLTAGTPEQARIPLALPDDRTAIAAALTSIGPLSASGVRLIRVRSTAALTELDVSEAYAAELEGRADLTVVTPPRAIVFDGRGGLPPFDDA